MHVLLYLLLAERPASRQQHVGSAEYLLSRFYVQRGETLELKTSAVGGGREDWEVKVVRGVLVLFFNCVLCQGVLVCSGVFLALRTLCSIWVWLEQLTVKVNEVVQLQVYRVVTSSGLFC